VKYTVFRNMMLLGAATLCAGAGLIFACRGDNKTATADSAGATANAAAPSSATRTASAPSAPSATGAVAVPPQADLAVDEPLRALDREILEWYKTAHLTGAKQKDALPGKRYKVDAYKDEGKSELNRIKVDLDRDSKWDEKWDFIGPAVQRQVAPADDELYSAAYRLDGDRWRKK
jgi:hypothetical protein